MLLPDKHSCATTAGAVLFKDGNGPPTTHHNQSAAPELVVALDGREIYVG